MGQAKRRKDLGLAPEPTAKTRQRARIKRDNDLIGMGGMGFPMAMAALLGMMSRRRKSPFQELTESRDYYRQEANEEEYNREQQRKWAINQSKHVLDPDREWPEGEEEE